RNNSRVAKYFELSELEIVTDRFRQHVGTLDRQRILGSNYDDSDQHGQACPRDQTSHEERSNSEAAEVSIRSFFNNGRVGRPSNSFPQTPIRRPADTLPQPAAHFERNDLTI